MEALDRLKQAEKDLFDYFREPIPEHTYEIRDWRDKKWTIYPEKVGQRYWFQIEGETHSSHYNMGFFINSRIEKGSVKQGEDYVMLRKTTSQNYREISIIYLLAKSNRINCDWDNFMSIIGAIDATS